MWNTGTKIVANGLHHAIKLLDLEDKSRSIVVPPRSARMWDDTIVPWCDNDDEARRKPFSISNVETGEVLLVIFQKYADNTVRFYSYADSTDDLQLPYSKAQRAHDSIGGDGHLAPQSRIDLFVHDARVAHDATSKIVKRVWGLPAGLGIADAQSLLHEATTYWKT